jgi:hypothetical protein
VLHAFPRYCSITDGLLGEEKAIVKVCDTLAEAEALVAELAHDDDGETQTYLYRIPVPTRYPVGPDPDRDEDEIPF